LTAFSKKERYERGSSGEIWGGQMRGSKHVGVLGRGSSLSKLKNLCTKEVIRFNELKRILLGINSTVLSERLFYLECEGVVTKKIRQDVPPKVEYRLIPQTKEV
jgi:DNA-binding HxlR family transcriptional regulator